MQVHGTAKPQHLILCQEIHSSTLMMVTRRVVIQQQIADELDCIQVPARLSNQKIKINVKDAEATLMR